MFTPLRRFHASAVRFQFKKWSDLNKKQKQAFILAFVDTFKEKNPCSKSNVSYRGLAADMQEYDDVPAVFGILYNEIRGVSLKEVEHNPTFADTAFVELLTKH